MNIKRLIYFVTILIVFSLFAFFYYSIRYDAKIEFLFPSLHADWILQKAPRISFDRIPTSDDVIFRKRFTLQKMPKKCKVHLIAMREFSLSVNGDAVGDSTEEETDNWKITTKYNLLPYLRQGDNVIDVFVRNPGGPPALLFKGSAQIDASAGKKEQKVCLNSGRSWEVSIADTDDWANVGIAGPRTGEPASDVAKILFGVYLLFILLALMPVSLKERLKLKNLFYGGSKKENESVAAQKLAGKKRTFLGKNWPIIIIFFVMVGLNIHNTAKYPFERGLDSFGHVSYVKYIASEWRPPLADEGWEMYQPPLAYFLFAVVYKISSIFLQESASLKAVQFFSMLSGIGSSVLVFLSLKKLFPDNPQIQHFGLSVAAFLPLTIYMNPMISNEIFTAFAVSLALYVLLRYGHKQEVGLFKYLTFGLLAGLAFLSKFTGLFICLTIALVLLLRVIGKKVLWRRNLAYFVLFLLITFAVSGWFYLRNIIHFHDPFVGNWSEASGFHYEQRPGYRTLSFYAKFGSVFFSEPRNNIWTSFWDGMYGTMWFYGNPDKDEFTMLRTIVAHTILWLALLPTVAILLGFVQSIFSIFKTVNSNSRWYLSPYIPIVVLVISTIYAIIYYTMKNPFYSVMQAR